MLGFLVITEGFFMLASALVEFFYIKSGYDLFYLFNHNKGFSGLIISSAITLVAGVILFLSTFKSSKKIGLREGFLIVSMVWIFFSIFGTLPLLFGGVTDNFTDAFFESMSGFTTTGLTIVEDVEVLPHSLLLWRSVTTWLGGMGIVVLSLAILPFLGVSNQLFLAESSRISYSQIAPRIKDTARRLWGMYLLLTLILTILLYLEGMSIFDAVNHGLTTMASGGYSTKNASIGYWHSPLIHYTIVVFMIISGINFTLMYFAIFQRNFSKLFKDEEFRTFIWIIIVFTVSIFIVNFLPINTMHSASDFERNFRESIFQTVSAISTTGYTITNDTPLTSFTLLSCVLLLFSGACAGSTTSGMKIIRVLITVKNCFYEFRRLMHPNAVLPLKINNKAVPNSTVMNVYAFMFLFVFFILFGTAALMFDGLTIKEALVMSISSVSNNTCLPIGSFPLATVSKWVISFLMLIGRLEFFTIILLFVPDLWKK